MKKKKTREGAYTFEQVRDMRDALVSAGVDQPLTFPVRAGIAASEESRRNLIWLLEQVRTPPKNEIRPKGSTAVRHVATQFPGSTLTLWSSFFDFVNIVELMVTIETVGRHRTYVDVPEGLHCQVSRPFSGFFFLFPSPRRIRAHSDSAKETKHHSRPFIGFDCQMTS